MLDVHRGSPLRGVDLLACPRPVDPGAFPPRRGTQQGYRVAEPITGSPGRGGLSIGIVRNDGREYYAVSREATCGRLLRRIKRHEWLMANVVPSLPQPHGDWRNHMPRSWPFDFNSPLVKPLATIADEVRAFLLSADNPVLWADYGAYDHVALCQLWGPMVDLPAGIPMFTNDIQQQALRLGVAWDELPQQEAGHHNTFEDARHKRSPVGQYCETKFGWQFYRLPAQRR